jgi:two-component system sensor histidine kinase FlrB
LVLLNDLTETRRLQDQLARHERLSSLGRMVASLAHQIRTPLSAAMLYASHLAERER